MPLRKHKRKAIGQSILPLPDSSADLPCDEQLVQERLPVCGHPSCGSGYGLTLRMRMRGKEFHTFNHPVFPVIEEPVLIRLKAGYDRVPRCRRMLGCMLTRRTVTASNV